MKVCVGKNGATVQRTIGGTLLSGVKLCHVKGTEQNSGTKCADIGLSSTEKPTASFKKCEDNQNNYCGTDITSGHASNPWCQIEYSCKAPASMNGVCSSAGVCS